MDSTDDAFWKKKLELARAISARSEPLHLRPMVQSTREQPIQKKIGRKLSEETKQKLRDARTRQTARERQAASETQVEGIDVK